MYTTVIELDNLYNTLDCHRDFECFDHKQMQKKNTPDCFFITFKTITLAGWLFILGSRDVIQIKNMKNYQSFWDFSKVSY